VGARDCAHGARLDVSSCKMPPPPPPSKQRNKTTVISKIGEITMTNRQNWPASIVSGVGRSVEAHRPVP
jgi:hypothetical protein